MSEQYFSRVAVVWKSSPQHEPAMQLYPQGTTPITAAATDLSPDIPAAMARNSVVPTPRPSASFDLPPPWVPGDGGRRYTWEQCYANLEMLWQHYGRAPRRHETHRPPSRVSSMAYDLRFGSWTATLRAFEAYRAGNRAAWPMTGESPGNTTGANSALRAAKSAVYRHLKRAGSGARVPAALRYHVLVRDGYRCTACGADPKLDTKVRLHVDHKIPLAFGGATTPDNLRTLCSECNHGKGAHMA